MSPLTSESGQQRLTDIACEYEAQGYEVKVQPAPGELPDFLSTFEPDLIATGKGETVVVEVKSRSELGQGYSATALESALSNRPGWRFELIIEGSAMERPQTVGANQIRSTLDEADELQRNNHLAAALLLLWSGSEGALRQLAMNENIELESLAPGYVLTRLYTLGLLGREQYKTLNETMRLRNRAAHGFEVSITPRDLAQISATLRELLSEVESKAA